mmetsp:Transcript_3206/g.9440  ORF Transcript_3206/g.9440 Transcript_3206/m.9440 type:complete len:278 (+) Transcript_3206:1885-2718(+)
MAKGVCSSESSRKRGQPTRTVVVSWASPTALACSRQRTMPRPPGGMSPMSCSGDSRQGTSAHSTSILLPGFSLTETLRSQSSKVFSTRVGTATLSPNVKKAGVTVDEKMGFRTATGSGNGTLSSSWTLATTALTFQDVTASGTAVASSVIRCSKRTGGSTMDSRKSERSTRCSSSGGGASLPKSENCSASLIIVSICSSVRRPLSLLMVIASEAPVTWSRASTWRMPLASISMLTSTSAEQGSSTLPRKWFCSAFAFSPSKTDSLHRPLPAGGRLSA